MQNITKSRGIVTITDSRFFPGAVALINSINANSPAPVTIIDQGMTEPQKRKLESLGANVISVKRSIDVDSERFGCCYALFDIDSSPYELILYIDVDCLVLDSLESVFDSITDNAAVVSYANPARLLRKRRYKPKLRDLFKGLSRKCVKIPLRNNFLGLREFVKGVSGFNLNTGVVGITQKTMANIKENLHSYQSIFDKLTYPDQDLFAILIADHNIRQIPLNYRYNATRLHCNLSIANNRAWVVNTNRDVECSFENGKLYLTNKNPAGIRLINSPVAILHYNSIEKPWKDVVLRDGFKEVWEYYYNKGIGNSSSNRENKVE